MSKAVPLTLYQFAHDLGAHQRLTREVSFVWHKQYAKATPATRQAMREEFMAAFVLGYCRGEKSHSIRRNAEMAASQKFKYHISRDGAKDAKAQPEPSRQRVSKVHRDAAMDFLANFEGDTLEEQIKQALAVLRIVAL